MAVTYIQIAKSVVATATNSVIFDSIPQTYTDLVLKYSVRLTAVSDAVRINFNNDSSANYYLSSINASSGGMATQHANANTNLYMTGATTKSDFTASIFSSAELYIPAYTSTSLIKCMGLNYASPNSTTTSFSGVQAHSYNVASAITKIELTPSLGNFDVDSGFYLYGISNA